MTTCASIIVAFGIFLRLSFCVVICVIVIVIVICFLRGLLLFFTLFRLFIAYLDVRPTAGLRQGRAPKLIVACDISTNGDRASGLLQTISG